MFELPSPFETQPGTVRLLEPAGSDPAEIRRLLVEGRYDKPFVIEDRGVRALHFAPDQVQSAMTVAAPNALNFRYTREMMGFLLFRPRPRRILMLGLGGGSLAKFCLEHLPEARITVVENNAHVVALRGQFMVPPDGPRLEILVDDGAEYVARCETQPDAIVVDAFDRHGYAPTLASPGFYALAREALGRDGVLVANLVGDRGERLHHVDAVRSAFGDASLLLPVPGDGNDLVFAFRNPSYAPRWRAIDKLARELKASTGLDYPRLAKRLERSDKLGYLRRALMEAGAL
jgi:spermidine synthase